MPPLVEMRRTLHGIAELSLKEDETSATIERWLTSLGLAPKIREELFAAIGKIHAEGVPVLLVEQEVAQVFRMASRNYVLSQGRILAQGTGASLMADETLRAGYLGL